MTNRIEDYAVIGNCEKDGGSIATDQSIGYAFHNLTALHVFHVLL
jgi:hypothetical protein